MKNGLPIATLLVIICMLIPSCDSSSSGSSDKTAQVILQRSTGAAIRADSALNDSAEGMESIADSKLYWTYTAEKTDDGKTTGATGDDAVSLGLGLSEEAVGSFSYGDWEFTLNAYTDEALTEAYYIGIATSATLNSSSQTVTCLVSLSSDYNGTLIIKNLKIYQKDSEEAASTDTISNYNLYYAVYASGGSGERVEDEDLDMLTDEGISISLEPNYYTLELALTLDEVDITAYTLENIYIRVGGTTTVEGSLVESTTTSVNFTITDSVTGTVDTVTVEGGAE